MECQQPPDGAAEHSTARQTQTAQLTCCWGSLLLRSSLVLLPATRPANANCKAVLPWSASSHLMGRLNTALPLHRMVLGKAMVAKTKGSSSVSTCSQALATDAMLLMYCLMK